MANYANVTDLTRAYPVYPIDPELNFAPWESFRDRSTAAYRAENQRIDAIIYRITDRAHTDALIENVKRGVGFRLISETQQYRDESRLWHAWNVDRLYKAGVDNPIGGQPGIEIRHRFHRGLMHEKLSIMVGSGVSVFGSSNWTTPSSDYQFEHNLFTTDPVFYAWSRAHFDRKWNNTGPSPETQSFIPLPPDKPWLGAPADNATAQPLSVTLYWEPGPWAHRYDVLLGTNPATLVPVIDDQELGPYGQTAEVTGLAAGTRYYWQIVSRTMADVEVRSDVFSFVTTGTTPSNVLPTVSLTSPASGASFTAPATVTLSANAADADGTIARVEFLAGSTVVGSTTTAPYAFTWTNVPAGEYSIAARAVDNLGAVTTSSAVTISVSAAPSAGLPAPWHSQDVGGVALAGSANFTDGTWSVTASGADIWGTADQFHFVHQLLTGDGSVVARVSAVQHVDAWTKAGVMIRTSLDAAAAHGFMIVTPNGSTKGLAFQRRTATGGASTHTAGGDGGPPTWVKLTRVGDTLFAYRSPDGSNWALVGSDTIAMGATVYAGLAVTSHNNGALATATFDNVSVTPVVVDPPANVTPSVTVTSPASGATFGAPASVTITASASDSDGTVGRVDFYSGATLLGTDTSSPFSVTWSNVPAGTYALTARVTDNLGAEGTSASVTIHVSSPEPPAGLPTGWASQDIGAVGAAGSTTFANGAFTVRGSGADIWGAADAFHFAYRTMTGDGTIVARVQSLEYVDRWTKAGVMIRASLAAGSRHAMMVASPGKGFAFQRRVGDNTESVHTAGPLAAAPGWVKLQRTGNIIEASVSFDGATWESVGFETIALPQTVYVGLPLTSHYDGLVATGIIDSVNVTNP
jgi:regulation of enolase protein 1 (concanavalin A-like superfamily)